MKRQKIYLKNVHVYMTEHQYRNMTNAGNLLGVNNSEIIRALLEKLTLSPSSLPGITLRAVIRKEK